MPLTASVDDVFAGGAVGAVITTPSGATLTGTQPSYVSDGGTPAKTRGDFSGTSTTASYWRRTFTADSDYGQMTTDFLLTATPSASTEVFDIAGSGAALTSNVITTNRLLYVRDTGAAGTGITGWTPPTLALNTPYRFQQAIIKGASTTTGSMKTQLVRLSDGAILATGLADGTANTGTVQTNGCILGKRTTTTSIGLQVISNRISNQAFDYLGDVPAASGTETFPTTATELAGALGFIGDSTTDRSGSGSGPNGQVEARIVANGQGWTNYEVRVNGLTSRTINFDNGVHPTAIEQIAAWRAEGFDPYTWAFAVGGNGGGSNQAQQVTWLNQLLDAIESGSRASYRVIIFGFARYDPANADAARFTAAAQSLAPRTKAPFSYVDYNSLIHNGRDETSLWQSTSPTEAHMTTTGYTLRDSLMTPYLTAPPSGSSSTATSSGTPSVYVATVVTTAVVSSGPPTTYTAVEAGGLDGYSDSYGVTAVVVAGSSSVYIASAALGLVVTAGTPSVYIASAALPGGPFRGWGIPMGSGPGSSSSGGIVPATVTSTV